MSEPLIYAAALTFFIGLVIQHLNIRLAHRFKLLDIPTARRRHNHSTPITGGVGLFVSWLVGLGILAALDPGWVDPYRASLIPMGVSIFFLVVLGLIDDLRGLSPLWKLTVEFVLAAYIVALEPQVNAICTHWSGTLGVFVWPMAMIWIVGITNSINLIDGLDGLAGGMSLLVAASIGTLSAWTGAMSYLATISMLLLVPATLAFLKYNWSPAKIFLGDNGSLPLGFAIATTSLMCRPQTKSWIMIASVILMLGYPILDMGLAVLRRHRKRFPLFKADRNHLHHRIQRLGLSVPQTAGLLLSIGLYLQVGSLCINLISQPAAVFAITVVCFSIFSLLHLIRSIERWRVRRIFYSVDQGSTHTSSMSEKTAVSHLALHLELEPLLEAAMFEERSRYHRIVAALELMMTSMVRPTDMVLKTNQRVTIVFMSRIPSNEERKNIEIRFNDSINQFLSLYALQCSLAGIPLSFERVSIVKSGATIAIIPEHADSLAA